MNKFLQNRIVDDKEVKKLLKRFPDQVRYVHARTLTKLAQKSQEKMGYKVQNEFDTTRKWWGKNQRTGFKVKAATKRVLRSRVFTGDKMTWAARQEYGEARKAKSSRGLVIPNYSPSGRRLNKKDKKFSGIYSPTWMYAEGKKAAYLKYSSSKRLRMRTKSSKTGKMISQTVGVKHVKGGLDNQAVKKYPFIFDDAKGNTYIKRSKKDKPKLLFVSGKRQTKRMRKRLGFVDTVQDYVRESHQMWFGIMLRQVALSKVMRRYM